MTDRAAPGDGEAHTGPTGDDRDASPKASTGTDSSQRLRSSDGKPSGNGASPSSPETTSGSSDDRGDGSGEPSASRNRRRRGSRGGRNRNRRPADGTAGADSGSEPADGDTTSRPVGEGRSTVAPTPAANAPTAKPKIGDTRPAPEPSPATASTPGDRSGQPAKRKRRRRGRGGGGGGGGGGAGSGGGGRQKPVEAVFDDDPIELDAETLELRRGQERNGQPVGRYTMVVHHTDAATQIAILEGRALIEHYVARPADDTFQIHGNVYLGKVQNVLPGMEAAFIDIGTPKNAVLYRGDVAYDRDDVEGSSGGGPPRIEQVLKNRQTILCQVTKNPIAHKGARLTQEVSLPGRFVVLVPNSKTYGISKRLPDKERKRLRGILDRAKPAQHGVIVRTAAENVTAEEIERDVARLLKQWDGIEKLAAKSTSPALLYREPEMAMRVIREEFTKEFRSIVIDDKALYEEVNDYVSGITPALADRVVFHDDSREKVGLFERFHIHEQLVKALDRKVWLPSGGSLIIEHTEALTVIDVNTGKNVGRSSLEETVYRNNLEAAKEVARQLRLRDIGGIIVIDFVDMEIKKNRDDVIRTFREALARDKTRTQVFDISELGLVEMTRKRIGEGLLESFASTCEHCNGLGHDIDQALLGDL